MTKSRSNFGLALKLLVKSVFRVIWAIILMLAPYVILTVGSVHLFNFVIASFAGLLGIALGMVVAGVSGAIMQKLVRYGFQAVGAEPYFNDGSARANYFWNIVYWVVKGLNWVSGYLLAVFSFLITVAYFTSNPTAILVAAIVVFIKSGNYFWNKM